MMNTMNRYNGPNDPRFARNSGFLETIGIFAVGGGFIGYLGAWETVALVKTGAVLAPSALFSAIHTAGILPQEYAPILFTGGAIGAVIGGIAGFFVGDVKAERHLRGRVLHNVKQAARALCPGKKESPGVYIHPKIQISEAQECRHMLLLGGSGSGKTSILWPIIQQTAERGDKTLIFSFKGDFQEKAEFPFTLIAPWDQRSARWQLGKDIRTRLRAESLSKTIIPTPDKDPMWAQGAQSLLVSIISELQQQKGERWGFPELGKACSLALSDYDSLVQTVLEQNPLAKSFLISKDSKTTASYLAQLASNLSDIINLGVADLEYKGRVSWSVRDWLAGKTDPAVILGFLPESEHLSQAFCSSVIEQIVKQVLSFPDASPQERRIWLFLDEVPQAGKIPSITSALEAARSKGCRIILGMQGVAQLEEHGYSRNTIDIWSGQTGIKIIANLSTPKDQKWAADLLGERELERYQQNTNVQNGGSGQSGGYQRVREHLMMPAMFGTDLHIGGRGPRALLVAAKSAAIIDWPFPELITHRPAFIEANWLLPSFQRPRWGLVPPSVGGAKSDKGSKESVTVTQQPAHPGDDSLYIEDPAREVMGDSNGGGLGEIAGDKMMSAALDHLVAPGVGTLFEAAKMINEMINDHGGGSSGAIQIKQPAAAREEREDEAE